MKGIGGTIEVEIQHPGEIRFEIDGLYGPVAGTAEVRYCRADPQDPARFRIGLLILQVGRIDQARWVRMLRNEPA
ncbi:MAG: hypothetical protein C4320_00310 [Armatimonadota bacterium]